MYSIPLGIALGVPIIHYEWYVINEETQLAACFIAFSMIVYKELGQTITQALSEDAIKTLKEQNAQEDRYIASLKVKHEELLLQDNIVQDNKDILALKYETYKRLNETGKVKPLHDFKGQIEKALSVIAVEEMNAKEKGKVVLMEEATAAVRNMLLTDKKIQKMSLDNAIAQLQGKSDTPDVVKNAYLDFFKSKKALKIDEKTEIAAARANIITRLNAIASTEGFMFKFGPDGKPTML
jgi:Mitochondrial ATP synthase B chain precursor (ATP-synt_B)